MKPRPPDDSEHTASEAMRAALGRQLGEPGSPSQTPPPIPDHNLLHRIGHGAYGDVWLARNALGTLRAVKVVYRAHFEEDRPYEREFNGILKFEPVSRTHEGLVQVLHVGRNDVAGCFYYVMELADSVEEVSKSETQFPISDSKTADQPDISKWYRPRTLRSELAQHKRLPPVDAAQLALRIARALAHLHKHDLVHRDVKPSNVIFVGGQPKLADIGLVADVGNSHSYVGTEGFVPPEGPGSPQADLFALGKLLYELATGRDRLEFPQLPAHVNQLPDGEAVLELNEVMTRACAPDPDQRYATATELEADLNLFLAGRSLRRARNIERHLARLKNFAAVACGFLVLAAVALWLVKAEERRAQERAQTEAALRRRAEAAERETAQQLYTALIDQARAVLRSGEMGHRTKALDALRDAAALTNTADLRGEIFSALALPDMRPTRQLSIPSDITVLELDPTFARVAIARGAGPVEIRSAKDFTLEQFLPTTNRAIVLQLAWHSNGRFLAVHRKSDKPFTEHAEIWNVSSTNCLYVFPDLPKQALTFHPRLAQALVVDASGVATLLDLEQPKELGHFPIERRPTQLVFAPDGQRVAVIYIADGPQLAVFSVTNGAPLVTKPLPQAPGAISWHPGGRWISVPDVAGLVQLFDVPAAELRTIGRHDAQAATSVFSPDGRYLVTGSWHGELIVWDVRAMRRAFTIPQNTFYVQFRRDGGQCAFLEKSDWQLRFFYFELPIDHHEFPEDLGTMVREGAFSPDGRWLATAGFDQLGVWDLDHPDQAALVTKLPGARLAFAANSRKLYASTDKQCQRWQLEPATNGTPQWTSQVFPDVAGFNSVSANSNAVFITSSKGTRRLTPDGTLAGSGSWIQTPNGLNGISPDGQWLAIYESFGTNLHVYNARSLSPVAELTQSEWIGGFAFSPQGDEVSVFCRSGLKFWSTATWAYTRTLTNFTRLLYTPDGHGMWLDKGYRQAGLYDARTLELRLPLPHSMTPLALSPDGRRLAVSIDLQRVQVWDIAEVRAELHRLGMDW